MIGITLVFLTRKKAFLLLFLTRCISFIFFFCNFDDAR